MNKVKISPINRTAKISPINRTAKISPINRTVDITRIGISSGLHYFLSPNFAISYPWRRK